MGFSSEVVAKVKEKFANKSQSKYYDYLNKLKETENIIPEIKNINKELSNLSMNVYKIALDGGDIKSKINALKIRNKELISIRSDLLKKHNYSEDYLDIKFDCSKCNDTGYIGIAMCDCMKKEIIKEELSTSSIAKLLDKQSFETFSLDYYFGKEKESMKNNLEILQDYAKNFDCNKSSNLLFIGNTGLGKTHLSSAVTKVIIENGNYVVYDTIQDILASFENERFGDGNPNDGKTDKYFNSDLLIIDDLGTEICNQFTISVVYNIINTRINTNKPMIISTNLTHEELRSRYSDRITSRILGEFLPLMFFGQDIRKQKLLK